MTSEIYTKIRDDIKTAMKAKDQSKVSCLRFLDSELQNEALKARKEIADDMIGTVISRGIKQREDAIEMFKNASRQDLVEDNEYEISIYKLYQPIQLTSEELAQIIDKAIADSPSKQMGQIMGLVMQNTKGRADGKLVNQMVKDKLLN